MNKFKQTPSNLLYKFSPEIKQSLGKLLKTFKFQFTKDETGVGTINLTKMQLDTGTSMSVS